MQQKQSKLKDIFTPVFIIAGGISLVMAAISFVAPDLLSSFMTFLQTVFGMEYTWFAQMIPFLCMVLLIWLACSRKYGHIKIGGQLAKPEYSMFSWLGMLFTGSIGMGLIAFAVNEPLYAFYLSSACVDLGSTAEGVSKMAAAREAMATSMYHWGVSVWAIFAVAALGVGYFVTRHKGRYLPGDSIIKAWPKKKWTHPLATFINVLACICGATTISASIGIGVVQIATGIVNLWGLPEVFKSIIPFVALVLLVVVCVLAVSTKQMNKGMNIISNWNMYICIFVLVFAIVTGPTRYIFEQIVQTLGDYIMQLIPRSFQMFLHGTDLSAMGGGAPYKLSWDVVNNMFWVSWAPFMSVFIASISKGRTIRQYVAATLTIPATFMLIWNCTFGGISLLNTFNGDGSIAAQVMEDSTMTFFNILNTLPLAQIMTVLTVILLFFFLATTVTSCALALGRMTDRNGMEPSKTRCIAWLVLMSAIALVSLAAASVGGAEALVTVKSMGSTFAYPYLFFLVLTAVAFVRRLRLDELHRPTPRPGEDNEISKLKAEVAALKAGLSGDKK